MSEALNPLRNISRLAGIQSSDHHRDGASVEQDNWDEPTRFLWQTISVATLNLYYLSIYHDVFIVKEYGEPPHSLPLNRCSYLTSNKGAKEEGRGQRYKVDNTRKDIL